MEWGHLNIVFAVVLLHKMQCVKFDFFIKLKMSVINNCHVYIVNLILKVKIESKPVLGFY